MNTVEEHVELLCEVSKMYADKFIECDNPLDILAVTLEFTDKAREIYINNYEHKEGEHELCVMDVATLAVGIAGDLLRHFKPEAFSFGDNEDTSEVSMHIYEPCGSECDDCEYKDECDEFEVNK